LKLKATLRPYFVFHYFHNTLLAAPPLCLMRFGALLKCVRSPHAPFAAITITLLTLPPKGTGFLLAKSTANRPTRMSFMVSKVHLTKGDFTTALLAINRPFIIEANEVKMNIIGGISTAALNKNGFFKAPIYVYVLEELAKPKPNVLMWICPGFSADCLRRWKKSLLEGKRFHSTQVAYKYRSYLGLNENEAWIHAMTEIALENLCALGSYRLG
jgi:hypothetical protein